MTIDVGNTHKGRTFQHMWELEQEWILWFVQHYGKSSIQTESSVGMQVCRDASRAGGELEPPCSSVSHSQGCDVRECQSAGQSKAQSQADACQNQEPVSTELRGCHRHGGGRAQLQQHLDGQTVTTTQADVMSLQFRMTNMDSMIQQV